MEGGASAVKERASGVKVAVSAAVVALGSTGWDCRGGMSREERRMLHARRSGSATTTSRAPRSQRGQGTNVLWRYVRVVQWGWQAVGGGGTPQGPKPGKGG